MVSIRWAAGALLASGLAIPIIALIVLIAGGAFPAFSAGLQGSLAAKAPYSTVFRATTLLYAVTWIVQLLGFGLLTVMLVRAGDESLAIPAFTVVLVAAILGVLHGTFNMSVEIWASQEAARTGSIPEIYMVLQDWISDTFWIGYLLYLAATAVYGWAILRTGLLSPWLGAAAIGWSLFWLLSGLLGGGAPAIPLIIPAVIGAAMFWTH